MAQKIALVNDQSGDEKDANVKDVADLQLQGYRIVDVGAYNAAVAAGEVDAADESPMAEQSKADASEAAKRDYPEAKPAAVDKPKTERK